MDTISERAENTLSEIFRLSEQAAVGTDKETLRKLYAEMMFHLGQLNAFEPLVGPFDVVLQSPFANHHYEVSVGSLQASSPNLGPTSEQDEIQEWSMNWTNERNNHCTSSFRPGNRYQYDSTLLSDGFQQYDTTQDAWYFGVWVHIERRMILTYAE